MKTRLESQNVALQEAVQTRTLQLEEQEKELETAREIQARLIPARIPQLPNLEIVGSYQPGRVAGGDYFDVIKFSETRVAVGMADVVGKGIAAALLMANVQAAVMACRFPLLHRARGNAEFFGRGRNRSGDIS
jgi:serine phosphatase RsbU (regulator of sigma subunit)